jgi:hypothetical protein
LPADGVWWVSWRRCGRFAWPILLAVAVLSLLAWPWANQQILELKARYEKRGHG